MAQKKQKLIDRIGELSTILYGFKTSHFNERDTDRLEKIFSKPSNKWVSSSNSMASKITHLDKAISRAVASVYISKPKNREEFQIVEEMVQVFLRRAVQICIKQLDPQGELPHITPKKIVQLRKNGVI